MPEIFEYHRGDSPLLISFPHDGSEIPAELLPCYTEIGKSSIDADWYISQPYAFIRDLDVSFVRARYSRFVVDLNRSPTGELLYPGRMETAICPLTTFNGEAIFLEGREPDRDNKHVRIESYWQPYHDHIRSELDRIRTRHGRVILWDAHSIPGQVPALFEGVLPDLNFGTADGASCGTALLEKVVNLAATASDYSIAVNGRFKGGYITRHYGAPTDGIDAIQLEINQSNYLADTAIPVLDPQRSRRLSELLRRIVHLLTQAPI